MISKETCVKIWHCHNEVEKCNNLIKEMASKIKQNKDREPTLYNAFGEKTGLQLGVPSGHESHILYGVSIDMGVKIIEQHVKDNERRLDELMAIAKIELNG